ncbi:hypothetical protein [Bartonella rattaustraliani]|uniref:hypothetical protein n=1 Tax=Bartonella rattaustraliani TaxID=481139 RepID=UPI0002DCA576|nr:hypothetical protein [Bartonella rattaustraliani]
MGFHFHRKGIIIQKLQEAFTIGQYLAFLVQMIFSDAVIIAILTSEILISLKEHWYDLRKRRILNCGGKH